MRKYVRREWASYMFLYPTPSRGNESKLNLNEYSIPPTTGAVLSVSTVRSC
jgi:hypothetical protein